jgi:hypothetical protein
VGVDASDDSIGHGVNGWIVNGFIPAFGPAVLGVVEMHMSAAMRMRRVYAQEGMTSADIFDVY